MRAVGLSGQMHGATLLDAQERPLRPAILWNDGRSAEECLELERREPAAAHHHRQHHDAGLHRTEAALGGASRAGDVPPHRLRAAAEGFRAPAPDRREGQRHVRCRRHRLAGCRPPRMVRCHARRDGSQPRAHAHAGRRLEPVRNADRGCRRGARHPASCGRGRWRRQRRQRRWPRRRAPGAGIPVARHIGRALRRDGSLPPESRAGGTRVLPLSARPLAPDVGHAQRGQHARLGGAARRLDRSAAARRAGRGTGPAAGIRRSFCRT